MKAQFSNQLISSFLLYLEHKIAVDGEGYRNISGYFYPIKTQYSNTYTYASPFSQIIYDQAVPNTLPLTGVYVGNTFITAGQSGLAQIKYKEGKLYFTSAPTARVSGRYSVPEFTISLTNQPEYKILFETQKFVNPKNITNFTGLAPDEVTFPIIFVRDNGGKNEQYAFGGEDLTVTNLRLVILGDSQFNTDAVTSLIKDCTYSYVPLLHADEFPFNNYGGLKNPTFTYTGVVNNRVSNGSGIYIDKVQVLALSQGFRNDTNILQPEIFPAICDIKLTMPRFTR